MKAPHFKAGRFDQGVSAGVEAIADTVKGRFHAWDHPPEAERESYLVPAGFLAGLVLSLASRLFKPKNRYAAYRIKWDIDDWRDGGSFGGGSSGGGGGASGDGDTCLLEVSIMQIANISQAKAQLSALIAKVLVGEEVNIGKAGKPVARLVKYENNRQARQPGALKGTIKIADDFDELPEDLAKA